MKHLIHLILLIGFIFPAKLMAQEFSVESFRQLPNDVSAFINVVYDLNDDACALVKVVAPSDFAFSTPLGIVKRKDEVGEIWLYIPKGSRMLTLKHPEWGVLRDYRFDKPLESHMSYELRLNLPMPQITEFHYNHRAYASEGAIDVPHPCYRCYAQGGAFVWFILCYDAPKWFLSPL